MFIWENFKSFNTLNDASFLGQKGTLMTISFFGSLNNQSGIIKSTFSDENLEMLDSTKCLGNLLSGTLLLFLILLLQASNWYVLLGGSRLKSHFLCTFLELLKNNKKVFCFHCRKLWMTWACFLFWLYWCQEISRDLFR